MLAPGVTVSSWLEAMRTVDLEAFLGRRGEGERGGSRMLQPCMADLVTVGEGQEVLARVRGRNTVLFPPGSACRSLVASNWVGLPLITDPPQTSFTTLCHRKNPPILHIVVTIRLIRSKGRSAHLD